MLFRSEPISSPSPVTGRKSKTAASDLEELPALESSQLWTLTQATPKEVEEKDWIRERGE